MGLKNDIDDVFKLVIALENRQKKGETATKEEVDNLQSLTLTLDAIAESMIPEEEN